MGLFANVFFAVLFGASAICQASDDPKIDILNETPAFRLRAAICQNDKCDGEIKECAPAKQSTLECEIAVPNDKWFNEVYLRIQWLKENTDDVISWSEQHFILSFRPLFPKVFTIYAYYSNNESQSAVRYLQNENDKPPIYERLFRGWRILRPYVNDSMTSARPGFCEGFRIYFDAIYELSSDRKLHGNNDSRIFLIDADIEKLIKLCPKLDTADLRQKTENAKASYLDDLEIAESGTAAKETIDLLKNDIVTRICKDDQLAQHIKLRKLKQSDVGYLRELVGNRECKNIASLQ